jgi:serine/threonine protein kinase
MPHVGRTELTGGDQRSAAIAGPGAADRSDDERIARLLPHGPVELAGEGGMALVYRGHDAGRDAPVAIKVLRCSLVGHKEIAAAFVAEHGIVRRIAHPGVITTHGAGTIDGVPYVVLDWCEGQTLADLVAFEPLALRRAAAIGAELASALDAVHRAGVVHCDVKPANVILTRRGRGARLVDFGVARQIGSDATASDLVAGTPSYMAPEQWSGAAAPGSDIYSLGCVLYELVTGAPPFHSTFADIMRAHRDEPAPPVRELRPDLPAAFADLIMSMVAKDPADRPASMAEVATRLTALSGARSVSVGHTRTSPALAAAAG